MEDEEKRKLVADYLADCDEETAAELLPDEVLQSAALSAAKDRAEELLEAAAGDKARAYEALIEGKDVDTVKDETMSALKKEKEDLEQKLEERQGTPGASFGASDSEEALEERRKERAADDEDEGPDTRQEADARLEEIQSEQDCTRAEAIRYAEQHESDVLEALRG